VRSARRPSEREENPDAQSGKQPPPGR
jgi:hypothetical protein